MFNATNEVPETGDLFDTSLERNDVLLESSRDVLDSIVIDEISPSDVSEAKFVLPVDNTFEKIVVQNGEFIDTFDIGIDELHLDAYGGGTFDEMKGYVVKEGNLLPLIDAQSESHNFVQFFAVNENTNKVYVTNSDNELISVFDEKQETVEVWQEHNTLAVLVSVAIVLATLPLIDRKFTHETYKEIIDYNKTSQKEFN